MARLPALQIVQSATEDLSAFKGLAAFLYAIYFVVVTGSHLLFGYLSRQSIPLAFSSPVTVGTLMLRAGTYRLVVGSLVPWLLISLVAAWVNLQWASWVASQAKEDKLGPGRFWPSFWAIVKYWAVFVLIVAIGTAISQLGRTHAPTTDIYFHNGHAILLPDTSRRALAAAAAPVSIPNIILGFLVAMLGLWLMIRLLLLPARGAIGEGSGLAACWRDTRGVWWWLFRLMMIQAAIAVVARVISGAVFALIAFVAVAFGWITAPASMTVTAIYQWLGSPNLQSLSLVHSVLVAPVFGTVTFIFAGSIIRAALLVRNDIEAARSDPYGRVLAEWQAEQAKSMPRNNAWQ